MMLTQQCTAAFRFLIIFLQNNHHKFEFRQLNLFYFVQVDLYLMMNISRVCLEREYTLTGHFIRYTCSAAC